MNSIVYDIERSTLYPIAHVAIIRDGKILLVYRENTGCYDQHWCMPAGRVSPGESVTSAAVREAYEEVGLRVTVAHACTVLAKVDNVVSKKKNTFEDLSFFFIANVAYGTPKNMEPSKHSKISWFSIDDVPSNIVPVVGMGLECILNQEQFLEYGYK